VTAARVRHIERRGGAWTITTADAAYAASRLIGADGANSLTRRRLATAFRREQLSIATGFFARGVTSDEIVIELTSDPPGYLWSFPRPDHLAIGICAQADTGVEAGALRTQAGHWIQRVGLAAGARLDAYSWPIPSLSGADFDALDVAGNDWYLVGDAAGLVDPITREGIYFALQSAQFVAEALLGDSSRTSRMYTDRVRSEIAADLACAARLKAVFFRSAFTRLLISALTESERIRAVMADLVAGAQSYRRLKWRLATTMEWRLAWQVLRGTGRSGPYSSM
jgi:flavin-dependent dehydrogenase